MNQPSDQEPGVPGQNTSDEARAQELANRVMALAFLQQLITMPLVLLLADMRLSNAAPNIQPAMNFACLAMMAMAAMALGAPKFKTWATLKWLNSKPLIMGAFALLCIGTAVLITQVVVPMALERQVDFERRAEKAMDDASRTFRQPVALEQPMSNEQTSRKLMLEQSSREPNTIFDPAQVGVVEAQAKQHHPLSAD